MKYAERIELSISNAYLEHWTIYNALRELFQNSFDRAKEDDEANWFVLKDDCLNKTCTLKIGNHNTELSKQSLILGETNKKANKSAIGKFGEGYKLAILVLLRQKISVSILTDTERWVFCFEYSDTFEAKILVMYRYEFQEVTEDLTFELGNFPIKMYNSYTQYNLKLQDDLKFKETKAGEVLFDDRNKGKIFVGSLFVCKYAGDALYGYNFKPGTFALGRDRNIIDGFNADWHTAQVLVEAAIEDANVLAKVSENITTKNETKFLSSFISSAKKLTSKLWSDFREKNPEAIPVSSQYEYDTVIAKYETVRPIIVTDQQNELLQKADEYKESINELEEKEPAKSPKTILEEFFDLHMNDNSEDERELFGEIIDIAKDWRAI